MAETSGPRGFSLGAVVLAAGRSTRMGRPKLLLPWRDTSILGHVTNQWRNLEAIQIAVVCARDNAEIASELRRLAFPAENRIYNPTPDRGMFSSIQCAAAWPHWMANLTNWAIILGDQPQLRLKTLRTLVNLAAAQPAKVCQPARGGRRHHPVLLPKAAFESLSMSSAPNLKQLLLAYEVVTCEPDDPGLGMDIDSPEDYERAKSVAELQNGGD